MPNKNKKQIKVSTHKKEKLQRRKKRLEKRENKVQSQSNNIMDIQDEEDSFLKNNKMHNDFEKIEEFAVVPTYNIFGGIKNYILGNLEQLIYNLSYSYPCDNLIKYKCHEILELLDNGNRKYLDVINQEAKKFNFKDEIIDNIIKENKNKILGDELNQMERILIRSVVNSSLMEYVVEQTVDYGATRILLEFCYRAIRSGLVQNKYSIMPNLYVTKDDNLLEWSFDNKNAENFEDGFDEKQAHVFPFWSKVDRCNDELRVIDKLYGLTEESLKSIYQCEQIDMDNNEKVMFDKYYYMITKEYGVLYSLISGEKLMKKYNYEKLCELLATHNFINSNHFKYMKELNDIFLKLNSSNDYGNALIEVKQVIYNKKLLIYLSNEIIRAKKNKNLEYYITSANITYNKEHFVNQYNKEYVTVAETQYVISSSFVNSRKNIIEILNQKEIGRFGYYGDNLVQPKTPYTLDKGVKELLLANFDRMYQIFKSENPNRSDIDFYINDLIEYTSIKSIGDLENLKKKYIKECGEAVYYNNQISESQKRIIRLNIRKSANNLNELDYTILRCCDCLVLEVNKLYKKIVTNIEPIKNFRLCLAIMQTAMNLLQSNQEYILKNIFTPLIKVYYDSDGKFIEFVVIEKDSENSQRYMPAKLELINIDNYYESSNDNIRDIYSILTKNGRAFFSSSETIYKGLSNLNKEFDYSTHCLGYLKCIEYELNYRIGNLLKENIVDLNNQLTLGSFLWVIEKHRNYVEKLLSKHISNEFINKFKFIVKIRNNANHIQVISIDEFEKLRITIIDEGFLKEVLLLGKVNKDLYTLKQKEIRKFYDELNDVNFKCDLAQIKQISSKYEKIIRLNNISSMFYNYIKYPDTFDNRMISSEVDMDTLGFLLIKDSPEKKQGLNGVQYDYIGYEDKDYGFNILFRSKIVEDNIDIPGYFMIIKDYDNNELIIRPSEGAIRIRKHLYKNFYSNNMAEEEQLEIYIKEMKKYLENLVAKVGIEINDFKFELKPIILSEDIWLNFEKSIVNSFLTIKSILITIYEKFNSISNEDKKILINSSLYILDNIDKLFEEDKEYLFSYATIFLDDLGKVSSLILEDTKTSKTDNGLMFEIVKK